MNLIEQTKKLNNLLDIESDFGISIDILYNVLKYGIIDSNGKKHPYVSLRNNGNNVFPYSWVFYTYEFNHIFHLKDYNKTWFLLSKKNILELE